MESIDFYRVKEEARTQQNIAWVKYERLANTPEASFEERLTALRAAFQADLDLSIAEYNWRHANDLPG